MSVLSASAALAKLRAVLLASALVLAIVLSVAAPASAATVTPILDGLGGPLGLSIGHDGSVFVGEAFTGQLTAVDRRGRREVVASNPGGEIAGVEAVSRGRVVYTTLDYDGPEGLPVNGALRRLVGRDGSTELANLATYEATKTPIPMWSTASSA